ncbi:hypothetical protein J2Y69_001434 [Microbacterium resistens]|uniref:Uncharacterized protein n=1 Tax=Microbacterium resistens TaxID=156977 RepID=A0ABU1SB78_9MICO|nr:hypothetical protein [Microbacterium resistens]MDR6866835.1 hypothetical protein [Microbacterium resistens]
MAPMSPSRFRAVARLRLSGRRRLPGSVRLPGFVRTRTIDVRRRQGGAPAVWNEIGELNGLAAHKRLAEDKRKEGK